MRPTRQVLAKLAVFLTFVFLGSGVGNGYSVLTHEEMIDLLWKDQLRPMLLERFPQASDEDLKQAHAYAYGGSVVQDMGYYPFGNKYFSDLVHYVRTGDFVEALIRDSTDLDEYAFALGHSHTTLPTTAAIPRSIESSGLPFPSCGVNMGKK